MRSYAANILPTDAGYYTLEDAEIIEGQLNIYAGGSATIALTNQQLAVMTEYFRISVLSNIFSNAYIPTISVHIKAKAASGQCFNHFCNLTSDTGQVCTAEVEMITEEYDTFELTFTSSVNCVFSLWELCPEASDADIEVVIDGVKQSLPKLLYDRNYVPLQISQTSVMLANITYYLQNSTDLQGHLLLSFTASLPCTLTLHFIDNEATELFCPLIYDLHAGRGSIGVPHAYLNRLAGIHNTYVTARVSAGTLTIGTCGMLFTLDGGYLAERLLNLGTNIRDIAIRQTNASNGPDSVWTVGVDDNTLMVRRGVYSTRDIDFTTVMTMTNVRDAAIEFDGEFIISGDRYTIETEETPYIFFTDNDKTLYVQEGSDIETSRQIDTNVDALSVCRGFKSTLVPDNDQGLICVYIKNGNVYYKHYAYSNNDYTWLGPITLRSQSDAQYAQIHRLNDYRIGIIITTATENLWYISDRTYVSQAIKPEQAYYSIRRAVGRSYMRSISYPDTQTLTGTIENYNKIIVTASHNLDCLLEATQLRQAVTITGSGISNNNINTITLQNNVITIILNRTTYSNITVSLGASYFSYIGSDGNYYPLDTTSIVIENGVHISEHATYDITATTGSITMTPIIYPNISLKPEQALYDITAASGNITMTKITYPQHNLKAEQARYTVTQATGNITMTKVGVEPI